ncbi:MAG: hypothetical protein NTZ67_09255 [Gammaproteobacteria bacterium]|nr:hypothetical protein [Gammaproteobacteria bacterium]
MLNEAKKQLDAAVSFFAKAVTPLEDATRVRLSDDMEKKLMKRGSEGGDYGTFSAGPVVRPQ